MLENITASAPQPKNSNVFTVIWQGVSDVYADNGAKNLDFEYATDYATEVVPAEWGHISIESITKQEWLTMACGEEHDDGLIYDHMDLLFVIDGAVITVEPSDE